jgi:hypothetical protein
MKARKFFILWVSLLASAIAVAQADENRTSLCELAKAGEHMNGRRIRLTAVYLTDLLDRSVLKDRRCPEQYFALDWKAPLDPSLDAFEKAVYAGANDKELTQFVIEVSGEVLWQANENPRGTLIAKKIWRFKRVHGDWKKAK